MGSVYVPEEIAPTFLGGALVTTDSSTRKTVKDRHPVADAV